MDPCAWNFSLQALFLKAVTRKHPLLTMCCVRKIPKIRLWSFLCRTLPCFCQLHPRRFLVRTALHELTSRSNPELWAQGFDVKREPSDVLALTYIFRLSCGAANGSGRFGATFILILKYYGSPSTWTLFYSFKTRPCSTLRFSC